MRSDLVAESNRIEGYDWNQHQVRELVATHKELVSGPIGAFVNALRGDGRIYQALGLYRAHELADEWAAIDVRPREYEIRSLHGIIMAGNQFAGRYKVASNSIGGSAHKTTEPWDVPRAMGELADWWEEGTSDPALDATVAHAWLTHIHPFEDGNGRMARVLANLALAQGGYPPFLLRSEADRGQYYDALAASDGGDILPLYDLVVSVLRRTVKTMARPDYVIEIARDRLLTSERNIYGLWKAMPQEFARILDVELARYGWSSEVQGYPDLSSFALLRDRQSDGNSWFMKVFSPEGVPEWLLWYGYTSNICLDIIGDQDRYPSIFFSVRDNNPSSVHPYQSMIDMRSDLPNEVVLRPLVKKKAVLRWDYETDDMDIKEAARLIAKELVRR
ncbi:hypothetical protein GCM10027589_05020 [Actinocorallia lasiicapitis]